MFAMGFPAGLAIDAVGPKPVALTGTLLIFGGYLLLRFTVESFKRAPEAVVCLALFLVGTGGVSVLMSILTHQQGIYPAEDRGKVSAVLLAAYCLSGSVLAPVHGAWFPLTSQLGDFSLALAIAALVLGIPVVLVTGEWTPCARHNAYLSLAATVELSPRKTEHPPTTASIDESDPMFVAVRQRNTSVSYRALADAPASATETPDMVPSNSAPGPCRSGVLGVVLCTNAQSLRFWMLWLPVFVIVGSALALGEFGVRTTSRIPLINDADIFKSQ